MAVAYFDHHATTPCDPRVVDAMTPYHHLWYGNAGSRHLPGEEARYATDQARAQVARWLGASPEDIVFTSGATESDNLAVLGAARWRREHEGKRHLVTVSTEHKAILEPVAQLAREGFEVTVLPVDGEGLLDPDTFLRALRPDTALVSVMRVNNEIGVLQPLRLLGRACRERGIWLHCDAAQSATVSLDVDELYIDLLSVSAHKIYGPKGVGALYLRPGIELQPLCYGGGQERGLRPGTLPVPLLVGMGAAATLLHPGEAEPIRLLSQRLWEGLQREIDGITLNGSQALRAPGNLHFSLEGVEASALLLALRPEFALSTGSACSSGAEEPSHVLGALGLSEMAAYSSIRVGIGRGNTAAEVDALVDAVKREVRRLR
jgi:cysteine desulfurase